MCGGRSLQGTASNVQAANRVLATAQGRLKPHAVCLFLAQESCYIFHIAQSPNPLVKYFASYQDLTLFGRVWAKACLRQTLIYQ